MSSFNKNNGFSDNKQEVVSITYEEIGLFPRSFSRVLDRFLKQVFSDVENLVIQEYRFYRYLFLTTLKCLLILFFVPFFVNLIAKTYIVRPLTEYFWNTKQTEIFLNSYQQKRAFAELKDFEEKTYFESLIFPKSIFVEKPNFLSSNESSNIYNSSETPLPFDNYELNFEPTTPPVSKGNGKAALLFPSGNAALRAHKKEVPGSFSPNLSGLQEEKNTFSREATPAPSILPLASQHEALAGSHPLVPGGAGPSQLGEAQGQGRNVNTKEEKEEEEVTSLSQTYNLKKENTLLSSSVNSSVNSYKSINTEILKGVASPGQDLKRIENSQNQIEKLDDFKKTDFLINSYTMKSSLFVYQTQEADKNIQQRYQEKTIELAQRYNDQSIEAITNFFADLISLFTLFYLLYALEIQINITKSFLLEVFFGLDDSKKSLLILLITDLLVGYHSSNLWELFFEFLFHHYGLPESQTGIFLLVATLPVLLDVLFKYLIFRHLNRSSPATVATYHAMIE